MKNKRFYISLCLEVILVILAIIGLIVSFLAPKNEFMGGITNILYFTTQSNIWICFVAIFFIVIKLLELIKKKIYLKKWMYIIKLIFTVSITLTAMVYCFVLAPVMPEGFDVWSLHSVLEHILVPVIAIADLFIDEYKLKYTKKNVLLVTLPPLYYLIFSIFGYVFNIKYSTGENYPYFFLNFGSELKIFGLSKEAPYAGTFYWVMLMLVIVLGMGFIYRLLFNKLNGEK